MTKVLKRGRAALVMGSFWGVVWGLAGGMVELADNVTPGGLEAVHFIDMWPQTLAILGFPRGVLFAVLLMVFKGRRRFEELSLGQFAAWGVAAGLVVGAVPLLRGAGPVFLVVTTLLGALAGLASLAVARMAEGRDGLEAGATSPRVGAGTIEPHGSDVRSGTHAERTTLRGWSRSGP